MFMVDVDRLVENGWGRVEREREREREREEGEISAKSLKLESSKKRGGDVVGAQGESLLPPSPSRCP